MRIFLYSIFLLCSLCAEIQAQSEWTHRSLDGFMENGADPWIVPPNGTGGALRQGWSNTLNGFFTNEWLLAIAYRKDKQEAYTEIFRFDMPFAVYKGTETDFGDVGLRIKTMFHQSQDLSASGGVRARFVTGDRAADVNTWGLFPHVAVWSDVDDGWPLRGSMGLQILPDKTIKFYPIVSGSFTVAQTIIPHNAVFGDFTYYSAANIKIPRDNGRTINLTGSQVAGIHGPSAGKSQNSVVAFLTPDIRTRIAKNAFILLGVELPANSPIPFDYQVNLLLVKGF